MAPRRLLIGHESSDLLLIAPRVKTHSFFNALGTKGDDIVGVLKLKTDSCPVKKLHILLSKS